MMSEMNENLKEINPILEEIKKRLKRIYGKRLKSIILYGSYARGDADEGSDIDLIVLLDDMSDPVTEIEKFSDAIWELDLEYDTVISIIPFDEKKFKKRRLPIIMNAKKEGIYL
jgi:predicted nucleotidyltransferase